MSTLVDVVAWVFVAGAIAGALSTGLILGGLLHTAAGGGVMVVRDIPPDLASRVERVNARVRAHFLERSGWLAPAEAGWRLHMLQGGASSARTAGTPTTAAA